MLVADQITASRLARDRAGAEKGAGLPDDIVGSGNLQSWIWHHRMIEFD
jgi:hypothetical protein